MTKATKGKQQKKAVGQGEKRPVSKAARPVSKAAARRAAAKTPQGKKAKARAVRQARGGDRKGLIKFIRDVRLEMGKVTWPTRKDLIQSTIVVLVVVAIAATYVAIADFAFLKSVAWFIKSIAK